MKVRISLRLLPRLVLDTHAERGELHSTYSLEIASPWGWLYLLFHKTYGWKAASLHQKSPQLYQKKTKKTAYLSSLSSLRHVSSKLLKNDVTPSKRSFLWPYKIHMKLYQKLDLLTEKCFDVNKTEIPL